MTENVESIIIEHLRAIRADVASIKVDVRELKARVTTLEVSQGTILQHLGHGASAMAQLQISFDRMDERVEHIELRLELVNAP